MILVDTHIWLRWIIGGDSALPKGILQKIECTERLAVSSISCWEVGMLQEKGKIELEQPTKAWIADALAPSGVVALPLECEIMQVAAALPEHHKDPADRMIIATAIYHYCTLISLDRLFLQYRELDGLLIQ